MTSLQSWLFLLQIKCLLVSGMRDVRKEVGNLNQTISSHDSHQSAESGWSFPDDYLSTRVRQTLSNATPIEGCDTAKLTEHIEKVETMWNTCALVETMMFFLISIAICSDLRGTQAKVSGGIGVVVAIGGLPLPAICGSMISTIVNNYCEIKKTLFADIDGAAKMYLNFKGAVTISLSLLTAIASGCVIQYANSRPEDYDVVDAIEDAQDNRAIFADSD